MIKPNAIQIPVADIGLAMKWYRVLFPDAFVVRSKEEKPVALDIDGFRLEPILEDSKLKAARSGTVLVWSVTDLNHVLAELKAQGSYVYRRVKMIDQSEGECVVTDPFGNLIGLRGPYAA